MKENKSLQPRTSFRQKIILVLFGFFLFFVLLEACLRLGGFILLSIQEYGNLQSAKQKGAYRILCLGESTTQGKYPKFLEQALNKNNIGVRFSVIDKGIAGTNTTVILSNIESYLTEYHPDMVVTMMGVNDMGKHLPYEAGNTSKIKALIKPLRTYKLTKLLWLHILTKAKEIGFYKPKEDREGISGIRLQEVPADPDSTEDSLKKAIEFNPKNDRAYGAISALYEEIGKPGLAKEYTKKVNRLRLEYYMPVTINNYRKLKEILDKRGIRLVCVQYPMRNVEPLKKAFEDYKGIIFVDNEAIFKKMVAKSGRQRFFGDMFAGDFGHCTATGNRQPALSPKYC